MKSQYNLQAIRILINEALGVDQVDELAFDRFTDVYRKFEPDTSNSKKIIAIVDFADRYGRIEDLLEHIKEQNPHQYKKYESELRNVEPDSSSNGTTLQINDQRLADIDSNIQQVLDLLMEVRGKTLTESTRQIVNYLNEQSWESVADLSFDFSAKRYGLGYDLQGIKCTIANDGSASVQRSLTMLAYSEINSLDTYLLVPETSSTDQNREVDFLEIESLSPDRDVVITNRKKDFQRLSVELSFVPPLRDSDKCTVQMTEKLPVGLFSVNLPQEQIVQREIPYDYFAWNINRPTRRLNLQVTIPERYAPDIYGVDVRYAAASGLPFDRVQIEEQKRVQNLTRISQEGRCILTLDVDYPMIGLIYMIRWDPKPSDA